MDIFGHPRSNLEQYNGDICLERPGALCSFPLLLLWLGSLSCVFVPRDSLQHRLSVECLWKRDDAACTQAPTCRLLRRAQDEPADCLQVTARRCRSPKEATTWDLRARDDTRYLMPHNVAVSGPTAARLATILQEVAEFLHNPKGYHKRSCCIWFTGRRKEDNSIITQKQVSGQNPFVNRDTDLLL